MAVSRVLTSCLLFLIHPNSVEHSDSITEVRIPSHRTKSWARLRFQGRRPSGGLSDKQRWNRSSLDLLRFSLSYLSETTFYPAPSPLYWILLLPLDTAALMPGGPLSREAIVLCRICQGRGSLAGCAGPMPPTSDRLLCHSIISL